MVGSIFVVVSVESVVSVVSLGESVVVGGVKSGVGNAGGVVSPGTGGLGLPTDVRA